MSKNVRRIRPYGSGDIPAVQSWLEEMAGKGLFFKESGMLFAKFTRAEPKKMRYRLDCRDVVACDIPEEKKELYEQCGWQVVGDYNSDLVVVCTDDPDAPEIYTDPELLVKPLKNIMYKYMVCTLAFAVIFFIAFEHFGGTMLTFITARYTLAYYVFACLVLLLLAVETLFNAVCCCRLALMTKRLKKGKNIPTGERYGFRRAVGKVLIPLAVPVIIAWVVFMLFPADLIEDRHINDPSTLPFPTCEDFGWSYDSELMFAYESRDIFGSKSYTLGQHGDVFFRTDYYEGFPAIAKRASEERIEQLKTYDEQGYNSVMQGRAEAESRGYEVTKEIPTRIIYEYDIDGAHVFYLCSDHRIVGFHRQYIIVRYENKYIEVSCESTDMYFGELIPQYIALLKSAK